jgi:hypothetical protein
MGNGFPVDGFRRGVWMMGILTEAVDIEEGMDGPAECGRF